MRCRKRLEFPSDVYPPNEATKSIIENAIITAAAAVDIHLLRRRSEKTSSGGKGRCATTLVCHQAIAYRPQTKKARKTPTAATSSIPKDNVYADSTMERSNAKDEEQQQQQQPCTTTNNINTKPRAKRAYYTIKPVTADQRCTFSIRICLDPGQCWYLPSWAGHVYHNNHPRELKREPILVQPSVPRPVPSAAVPDSSEPQQQEHSEQSNHDSSGRSELLFRDTARSQFENVLCIIERANHDPELLQIWDASMQTMLADMKTWMEARRRK